MKDDIKELKNDLTLVRSSDACYYEKSFVVDMSRKGKYFVLLHKIDDYTSAAKAAGLAVENFLEIDALEEFGPASTIYHCITFRKP